MSELSSMLDGVVMRMRALEAENAQLRAELAAHAAVWPHVEALFDAIRQSRDIVAHAKPKRATPHAPYTDDDVRQWQEAIQNGATLKEVARTFDVCPSTIQARLTKLGAICACGVIIGTEENGIQKGHNGVCGYCRDEGKKEVAA